MFETDFKVIINEKVIREKRTVEAKTGFDWCISSFVLIDSIGEIVQCRRNIFLLNTTKIFFLIRQGKLLSILFTKKSNTLRTDIMNS